MFIVGQGYSGLKTTAIDASELKDATIQKIQAIEGAIKLTIHNEWEDITGLEAIAERVIELNVYGEFTQYKGLESFKNVQALCLSYGHKYDFKKFEYLKSLTLANWHNNYTKAFPECFPMLEEINLQYFKGHDLSILTGLKMLKHITLHCGSLKSLAGLEKIPLLDYLHVSFHRNLVDISAIDACTNLKTLELVNLPKVEMLDVTNHKGLIELKIDALQRLKNIKFDDQLPEYQLENITVFEAKMLENLAVIGFCHHLKDVRVSPKVNSNIDIDISMCSSLNSFASHCYLNKNNLNKLLHNIDLTDLSLSKHDSVSDFEWLTKEHNLRYVYVYFDGKEIHWEKIFSSKISTLDITCCKKLKIELSIQ